MWQLARTFTNGHLKAERQTVVDKPNMNRIESDNGRLIQQYDTTLHITTQKKYEK